MGHELAVSTWAVDEVNSVDGFVALVQAIREPVGAAPRLPAFRGVSRADRLLESTLDRLFREWQPTITYVERLALERMLLEEFHTRARPTARDDVERLYYAAFGGPEWQLGHMAIGRQHMLPTRLLDWSGREEVAAFFACMQEPDEDGVIWWYDQRELEAVLHPLWPDRFKVSTCEEHYGPRFRKQPGLSPRALCAAAFSLDSLDWISAIGYPMPFWRLHQQTGMMTMCGRLGIRHDVAIDSLDSASRIARGRILIPQCLKRELHLWALKKTDAAAPFGFGPSETDTDVAARETTQFVRTCWDSSQASGPPMMFAGGQEVAAKRDDALSIQTGIGAVTNASSTTSLWPTGEQA